MALIKIKQINNSPASAGDVITFNGTNNAWAPVGAADPFQRTAVNATTYTIVAADTFIGVQHTSTAAVTLTLPLGSAVILGHKISIKDEGGNSSINNITVNRTGSDTIDGDTSFILAISWGSIHVQWTGFEWSII